MHSFGSLKVAARFTPHASRCVGRLLVEHRSDYRSSFLAVIVRTPFGLSRLVPCCHDGPCTAHSRVDKTYTRAQLHGTKQVSGYALCWQAVPSGSPHPLRRGAFPDSSLPLQRGFPHRRIRAGGVGASRPPRLVGRSSQRLQCSPLPRARGAVMSCQSAGESPSGSSAARRAQCASMTPG
jgi:hypothetical protein